MGMVEWGGDKKKKVGRMQTKKKRKMVSSMKNYKGIRRRKTEEGVRRGGLFETDHKTGEVMPPGG